ncbi:MAG TPA: polysaccharide biosynthesis tyrosine autokinase [Bryobacteraceae bacterium]
MTIHPHPGSVPFGPVRSIPRGRSTGADDWSPVECARALFRCKNILAWITGLGVLVAALITLAQPRTYRSEASLEIQGLNENFLNLKDIYPTAGGIADATGVYVQTQAEMLQQDALLEQVVLKLGLEQRGEFQPRTMLGVREALASKPAPEMAVQNAIEQVQKNLEIVSSRNSRIIRIVAMARDPHLAAGIANTLARTFIAQSAQVRRLAAEQTRESLSAQLRDLNRKLLQSEADLRGLDSRSGALYERIKREVETNRRLYEAMAQKVSDAGVASAVAQSGMRLASPAQPAPRPFKPNWPMNLAIGTFGGLMLAIGAVMLREQSNSVVRAPGEAGMYLTLPELGAIPKAARRTLAGSLRNYRREDLAVERAALEQRFSGVSESVRATLASILAPQANTEDRPRLFVVTSSRAREGKTTVVSNLGIALAEISGRVLLIDGDMRCPRLHKVFDQANSWGLSDVLSEKNAIEDLELDVLVKKTSVPHLYILPSGACTENIFGLLCSARMARLLPRFRQEFDYVIVDAPPCLEFADARILARYTEQLLLVVRADYTDTKVAQTAVQRLLMDGIPVMGVILNRWNPSRGGLDGYGSYYGIDGRGLA